MVASLEQKMTVEEYFAFEEKSGEKYEYYNGKLQPMPGGTLVHNIISTNLMINLGILLQEDEDFIITNSDTKVYIPSENSFVYPDALVIFKKPKFHKKRKDTILNPVLIFEVLSKGTRKFDLDTKFEMYRSIPSFKEYVTVEQELPFIKSYFKEKKDLWRISVANKLEDSIKLHSIKKDLSLKRVYRKIPAILGNDWKG